MKKLFAVALPLAIFACVGDDNITPPNDSGADTTTPNDATATDATPNDSAPVDAADAGPWTPAVLDADGSLALWLEASSGNLTVSAGSVEKWSDLSKNHNDAINAAGGPSVDTAAVNGHDALTFGNGFNLTITDNATLRFGTDQFVIMTVGNDTENGPLGFFSKVQTKTSNVGVTSLYQGVELIATASTFDGGSGLIPIARFAQDFADAGTSSIQSVEVDAPIFDDGHFHMIGARRSNPSVLTVYADQNSVTNNATTDDDVSVPGIDVTIGALKYGKNVIAVSGDVAEIVVVHAPIISDATVTDLQTYLKTKYAL
jgi:hypothetical protein